MIVQRWTANIKPGRLQEAVAMVLSEAQKAGRPKSRVLISGIGTMYVLAVENEFEKLAESDKFWKEWFARPETPTYMEKWHELIVHGGVNEVWDVAG